MAGERVACDIGDDKAESEDEYENEFYEQIAWPMRQENEVEQGERG